MLRFACAAIVMVLASSWCVGSEINFSGGGLGGSSWSPGGSAGQYHSPSYTSPTYTSRDDSYSGRNIPYTTTYSSSYPRTYSYSYSEPYNYSYEYPYYSDSLYSNGGIGQTYWYDSNGYRHYNRDERWRGSFRSGRSR
jgi:hypothetical protein